MKKIIVPGMFIVTLLMSLSSYGQQMPVGGVIQTTSCNLNDGVSMREVVEWARANPRDPDAAGPTFFRQPLMVGNNFMDNYDFRIARYYGSYAAMISDQESRANRSGEPRVRPATLARDMFRCNPNSRSTAVSRNVPDTDGFTGDVTLMTSRFCRLNDGVSVGDAYNFVAGVAANFRAAGSNSIMQVVSRTMKPVQNQGANPAVVINTVATTADSMAARLDLSREGEVSVRGVGDVMSCGFQAMWRTYAIYRPGN